MFADAGRRERQHRIGGNGSVRKGQYRTDKRRRGNPSQMFHAAPKAAAAGPNVRIHIVRCGSWAVGRSKLVESIGELDADFRVGRSIAPQLGGGENRSQGCVRIQAGNGPAQFHFGRRGFSLR